MEAVRDVASAALRLREDAGLRVRLPLAGVLLAGADAAELTPLLDLLADEINVRHATTAESFEGHAEKVLRLNGGELGPRLGDDAQAVFAAARTGDWHEEPDGTVVAGGHSLTAAEYELALHPADAATSAVIAGRDLVIVLDTGLTPDLEAEGHARDLIRVIQQARKDADLQVTDRIAVSVRWSPPDAERVRTHTGMIAANVLATSFDWADGGETPVVELRRREAPAGSAPPGTGRRGRRA
ncbi:MAG TPA: hypothetical protein DEP69_07395 [Acidimicrobiaceae bacterium]|nr:hypothetical protein [Acidimicrobiaceae bacterium]